MKQTSYKLTSEKSRNTDEFPNHVAPATPKKSLVSYVGNQASLSQIAQDCIADPDLVSVDRWQMVLRNPKDNKPYSRRQIERFRARQQNVADLADQILFNTKVFIVEQREKYAPKERAIDQLLINQFGQQARIQIEKGWDT